MSWLDIAEAVADYLPPSPCPSPGGRGNVPPGLVSVNQLARSEEGTSLRRRPVGYAAGQIVPSPSGRRTGRGDRNNRRGRSAMDVMAGNRGSRGCLFTSLSLSLSRRERERSLGPCLSINQLARSEEGTFLRSRPVTPLARSSLLPPGEEEGDRNKTPWSLPAMDVMARYRGSRGCLFTSLSLSLSRRERERSPRPCLRQSTRQIRRGNVSSASSGRLRRWPDRPFSLREKGRKRGSK